MFSKTKKKLVKSFAFIAVVSLMISFFSGAATTFAATDDVVDLNTTYQTIRGFGGINHPVWIQDLTESQRDTAFGNGDKQLGLSILRIHIDPNKDYWSRELATAKEAIAKGAIVFASPWTPPEDMLEPVVKNGQHTKRLKYDKYEAYADYLNEFVSYMKDNGVDLYAISIQNEPDWGYEWTYWEADEIYNFTKNYASKINCRVISAESFQYVKAYYDQILNDPEALENIDILGTHFYGTQKKDMAYPLFQEKGQDKELWMTEVYVPNSSDDADKWPGALEVATNISDAMENGFQSYVWWYIRRGYGLIKENGEVSKRGYCMAQFSKFIRPGYERVDVDANPQDNVAVTAYKGDGRAYIVAINKGDTDTTQSFSVNGALVNSVEAYRTSSTENLAKSVLPVANDTFNAELPAKSVTTFMCVLGAETAESSPLENANLLNTLGNVFPKVGTCSPAGLLSDPTILSSITKEYNSLTAENEMKPDYILGWAPNLISVDEAKAKGYFIPEDYAEETVPDLNFSVVDELLKNCYENGLGLRGHTLVWHSQTPDWFFRDGYTKTTDYVDQETMNKREEFFVKNYMGHVCASEYSSVVYAWDVVNEYIHSQPSGWGHIYGDVSTESQFVKDAFNYAYETLENYNMADSVKLFYNDFNSFHDADKIIKLINFINEGKKVCAGVGMQTHLSTNWPSVDYYKAGLAAFRQAGFEIQITELDVGAPDPESQAKYVYDLFRAIFEEKQAGANITALVFWGLSDDHSWRDDNPLLYSDLTTKKPSYYSVMQAYFDAGYTKINDLNLDYQINNWDSGYQVNFKITNDTDQTVNGWTLKVNKNDLTIDNSWNVNITDVGDYYVITPADWNSTIEPGNSIEFGVQGAGSIGTTISYSLN